MLMFLFGGFNRITFNFEALLLLLLSVKDQGTNTPGDIFVEFNSRYVFETVSSWPSSALMRYV